MGLHLNYELRLPASAPGEYVEHILAKLRAAAIEQPFREVSPLLVAGRIADPTTRWARTLEFWSGLVARPYAQDEPQLAGDVATAKGFFVNPGRGCETASFGLLSRATGLGAHREWFWECFCKTQYASVVSDDHLVACHAGLVAVLDRALELGIDVVVQDETHYWETRDRARLVSEVGSMNRILACFAGALG